MSATPRLEVDLLAGDFYVGDPYSAYAWMRENEPPTTSASVSAAKVFASPGTDSSRQ